jgi:hypothetical protein
MGVVARVRERPAPAPIESFRRNPRISQLTTHNPGNVEVAFRIAVGVSRVCVGVRAKPRRNFFPDFIHGAIRARTDPGVEIGHLGPICFHHADKGYDDSAGRPAPPRVSNSARGGSGETIRTGQQSAIFTERMIPWSEVKWASASGNACALSPA